MNRRTRQAHDATPQGAARRLPPRIAGLVAFACLAVVAAAGAGTLAGFAARYGWRCELCAHFRVQYAWALTLAGLTLGALRWRRAGLAAVALALVNFALIVPLYIAPPSRADAGAPLKAMSFNVLYRNQNYGATLELILNELPDFVLLLEVTDACADALEFLRPDYPYQHVDTGSEVTGGLAFYSRHKISDATVHHSENGFPTLIVGVETPHGRLTLLGAHPASPRSAGSFAERNRQLAEVAKVASQRNGPVMLLGDLNTTSWSPYFRELLADSGLRDSRLGFGVEGSWPWFALAVLRIPIDHCLVSGQIAILNRWIGPAIGSDHRPLFVEFALPTT